MRIFIKAKPSAHKEKVEKIDETNFVVSVREPPVNGLANLAIAKALSDYLGVSHSNIRLVSGFTSKHKVFEIK